MDSTKIRSLLKTGHTIGTWLQIPSPDLAEVIGQAGYDWVAVDMEHGAFTRSDLPNIFRALELGNTAPFVRLPQAQLSFIKDALDSGAQGLIFPMISSRNQLDQAISLALYPNAGGTRGVGFSRANLYGHNFADCQPKAKDIILVAQIEHIHAVRDLASIISHPRLDAIMVGPYDLSGSMGLTGQFDHPDFIATMDKINTICQHANFPMGTHIVNPEPAALKTAITSGYRFIAYGIDAIFLQKTCARPVLELNS